jgi:hypothetical protein
MLEDNLTYIALGTRRKRLDSEIPLQKRKTILGAPWEIYAVSEVKNGVGMPTYYRVEWDDGALAFEELLVDTHEYNRVLKWVGRHPDDEESERPVERGLLHPRSSAIPSCIVTKQEASDLLEYTDKFDVLMEYYLRNSTSSG